MRANKNGVNKDQKDKVKKDGYNRGQHCVYCLTYHMIFVTHYRKPVINDEMSAAMKEFSNHMAEQFRGKVLSAETDRDHIHLLVSLPPNTNISVFVRSIKTQLSREMRKRFPEQIKQYIYGDDTSFWSRSYFIATTGSVSLETVKQYIESQRCELLGHRMAEHPKFPLNTDHSISAPLRISPHYTIRIAQADPLQTIHLTVMP